MTRKTRFYYLFFVGIGISLISLILGLFNLLWWYFVVGGLLGVLLHLLMEYQNRRFYNIVKDRFLKEYFAPRKDTILWYVLRFVIISLVFVLIVFLTTKYYQDRLLEVSILFLSAYVAVKITFIIVVYLEGRR
ncbi:MAG: hypothetical protein K6B64_04720 [Acholeplasmatales bacterium]|nr:hypothetical protein [Acholeplasmatales bacterium]